MKIPKINIIRNYVKTLNKTSILEIPKNPKIKLGKATCYHSEIKGFRGIYAILSEEYNLYNNLHIEKLYSNQIGNGTRAVKDIVKQSLNNPNTQGRVTVFAKCINGKDYPMGFYYKLGFRSVRQSYNEICQKWLENGGKKELSPHLSPSIMYLPRENIEHCLNYHNKVNSLAVGLYYIP